MTRTRLILVTALAFLIFSPAAMSRVYKWIDASGTTHYAQNPPPEGKRTVIEPETHAPGHEDETENDSDNQSQKKADNDADQGDNSENEAKTVGEFCKKLRKQRRLLASDKPVRVRQDDDTLKPLDQEQRTKRLQQVQGQISQTCQDNE